MTKIQNYKDLKKFLIFLFFSLLLLLLDRLGILSPIKTFTDQLFLPPKKVIYRNWQGIKGEIKEIKKLRNCREAKELEEKIEKLEQEMAILNAQYSILNTQYSAARRLLGTPLPPEWQFIPAQTAGLVKGILTIDKGKIDEVKEDQAVLVEDIFVGKVKEVGNHQAWVELPTAKETKLLVGVIPNVGLATTETKAKGILMGYGDKMRLEKVLQEEQLNEEDLVITGEFPPNLVVGKITNVIKNEVEIYQLAEVEPLLDYQKLEVVFLLK